MHRIKFLSGKVNSLVWIVKVNNFSGKKSPGKTLRESLFSCTRCLHLHSLPRVESVQLVTDSKLPTIINWALSAWPKQQLPALHAMQCRELCHATEQLPAGHIYPAKPKALQSWALLLLHQQSSSPTQCTALIPPHASPSLNACFLLVGNRQIFDRLRNSSCANSSRGVSSQADTMKARMLPKVNFESMYITEQRFLSRLHPHNSMVMHCNITAHLYLQPHDSLLMKQE